MSITAVVENDAIKLPPGVHVPDGTRVEITLPQRAEPESGSLPSDAAEHPDERATWLAQSERRLRELWENDEDNVYNELLAR